MLQVGMYISGIEGGSSDANGNLRTEIFLTAIVINESGVGLDGGMHRIGSHVQEERFPGIDRDIQCCGYFHA